MDEGLINNWRSSFFSPSNPVKMSSLGGANGGVLYCLEMTKNYNEYNAHSVDQVWVLEIKMLMFMVPPHGNME